MLWLAEEYLTVQYTEEPLAQYRVSYERDHKGLRDLAEPRLFETRYQSPQLALWELRTEDWRAALRLPAYPPRRRAGRTAIQPPLFPLEPAVVEGR